MNASKKTLAIVIGSAFVASIAATSIYAAENPFAIKSLSSGYMVAEADTAATADKPKDGKCGTGKCTASKKKAMAEAAAAKSTNEVAAAPAAADKPKDGKCGTGKCTASKKKAAAAAAAKAHEGSCSAEKAAEGSCHADKK